MMVNESPDNAGRFALPCRTYVYKKVHVKAVGLSF